jgi:hypothetical protein
MVGGWRCAALRRGREWHVDGAVTRAVSRTPRIQRLHAALDAYGCLSQITSHLTSSTDMSDALYGLLDMANAVHGRRLGVSAACTTLVTGAMGMLHTCVPQVIPRPGPTNANTAGCIPDDFRNFDTDAEARATCTSSCMTQLFVSVASRRVVSHTVHATALTLPRAARCLASHRATWTRWRRRTARRWRRTICAPKTATAPPCRVASASRTCV